MQYNDIQMPIYVWILTFETFDSVASLWNLHIVSPIVATEANIRKARGMQMGSVLLYISMF